jgi:hypothetical protein
MPRAKDIFPNAILGTYAIGPPVLQQAYERRSLQDTEQKKYFKKERKKASLILSLDIRSSERSYIGGFLKCSVEGSQLFTCCSAQTAIS